MSYDIYLREQVTGEVANVPGHLMIGGTYKADYHPETGTFTPALNTDRSGAKSGHVRLFAEKALICGSIWSVSQCLSLCIESMATGPCSQHMSLGKR